MSDVAAPRRPRGGSAPTRGRRLGLIALAGLVLCFSGCILYTADIRVARDGSVLVRERVALDPEWKASVGDTLQAAERVLQRYKDETKVRGGKVLASDADSVLAEFHYRSLAAFAHDWPDSADEGQQWDRSLYRRRQENGRPVDELILWRMSPPDRSRDLSQRRYPVLTFWVTLPAPPLHHNAQVVRDGTYGWQFTEKMAAPDSVWIVWPATEK